jgi:ATP-dependent helicase/nuclease subunit B
MNVRIETLGLGDIIITPNLRSARAWAQAANARARGQALPSVLATTVWLQSLWEGLSIHTPLPALLLPGQERALWQRVIARSNATPGIFSNDAMVAEAARAWRLANTWSCPEALLSGDDALDVQTFFSWQRSFQTALKKNDWITQAELAHTLAEKLAPDQAWPTQVVCSRVVTLPTVQDDPALSKLLAVLEKRGIALAKLVWREEVTPARCKTFARASDEWHAAALWAKEIVATNPQAQVVIVVPQLHQVRHAVKRSLRDVLVPQHWGDPRADNGAQFNLSLGVRLSEVPRVAAALAWLAWARAPQPLTQVRAALAAPFVPAAQFWVKKALDLGFSELSMAAFAKRAAVEHPVHAFGQAVATWPTNALPSAWSVLLIGSLERLHFPSENLDSENAQAAVALFEIIDGLHELDEVFGGCSADVVISELRARCITHDFQAEGKAAPIQVLGVYESLGIACDALWLTDATDETLPEPSELSPMLPRVWQRAVPVGRATPEVMREAAARMWAQWERAAPDFVVSMSGIDGEHSEHGVRPAACIPAAKWEAIAANPPAPDVLAPMQRIPDTQGTPFAAEKLPGGTTLLQQQAQCAFRAYAAYRLRVSAFPIAQIGLPALVRGQAVHLTLSALWRALQSQAQWLAADSSQQAAWVAEAVSEGMELIRKACQRRSLPAWLAPLYATQLASLIFEWMEMREVPRTPFQVLHSELETSLLIGGQSIDLRLDRVDQLPDGSLLVMDYKTGQVPSTAGLVEPETVALEPQLPAYALALSTDDAQVSGVAYARVVREGTALRGLARVAEGNTRSNTWVETPNARDQSQTQLRSEAWQPLQAMWAEALARRVDEFVNGEAAVAPARAIVCRTCSRQALCRIDAEMREEAGDDASEE